MQGESDEAMAAGLRRGDPHAFAAFVRATQDEVWRLAAHLADRQTADDVTQETYLRALRALPTFRGDSSLRTWLLAIARRVVADELRGRHRRRRLAETIGPVGDVALADPSVGVALRALVEGLEPGRREAFVLTQVLGLSYAEAAEVAGVPVGTIRSRVARARGDLAAALTEPAGESGVG